MTLEERIDALVKRLNLIARKNDDSFICVIHLEGNPVRYRFVARERADGHEFVDGSARTLMDAVIEAGNAINSACDDWSYKQ